MKYSYMKKRVIFPIIFFASVLFSHAAFFQDAIAQNARDYYNRANLYLTSGRISQAITNYNNAIGIDANFFEAYVGLSIAYRESGNYNKAFESIETAIKLKPDYYQSYYNKGLILEKQNKCSEAADAYEKFLNEMPSAAKFSDVKQRISRLRGCIPKK